MYQSGYRRPWTECARSDPHRSWTEWRQRRLTPPSDPVTPERTASGGV